MAFPEVEIPQVSGWKDDWTPALVCDFISFYVYVKYESVFRFIEKGGECGIINVKLLWKPRSRLWQQYMYVCMSEVYEVNDFI